jgi:hypothetical protein
MRYDFILVQLLLCNTLIGVFYNGLIGKLAKRTLLVQRTLNICSICSISYVVGAAHRNI